MENRYDYIIVGGGAAGLSLAYYMSRYENLRQKSVLILEKEAKNTNDRTWCFWHKGDFLLEDIVAHKWDKMQFKSPISTMDLQLEPYTYKMIRSLSFYQKVHRAIDQCPNIKRICANVTKVSDDEIATDKGIFSANEFVFNSVYSPPKPGPDDHQLYQHFKGWFVTLPQQNYDRVQPILMDFTIPQTTGCDFIYVLPMDNGQVLIEYTSFSVQLMEQDVYDDQIKSYMDSHEALKEYTILEKEYGVIPMTTAFHGRHVSDKQINIGIAGGDAKPSTGYTFSYIQTNTSQIAANLAKGVPPLSEIKSNINRFFLYDAILLRIIKEQKLSTWKIFDRLFNKLPPEKVLRFLDEETGFMEEFGIRNTMPQRPFIEAASKELWPFLKKFVGERAVAGIK